MPLDKSMIFKFKDASSLPEIPARLNNPFDTEEIPELVKLAAREFQDFIDSTDFHWKADLLDRRGKMFGVLVVQDQLGELGFLGTVSGKLPENGTCDVFVPSMFKDEEHGSFLYRGLTEVSKINAEIKLSDDVGLKQRLRDKRAALSSNLQQKLFDAYELLNINGERKSVREIFLPNHEPVAAAGECAAPKLFHFAFENGLNPVAIAEFWYGANLPGKSKVHSEYYPACKDKCKPVLGYMLCEEGLYEDGV